MKLREVVNQIFIDPRKLTSYALDQDNPKGADKAFMFQQHLGFTKENYQLLMDQIEATVMDAEAIPGKCDEYGQRYHVDLLIIGVAPNQQEIVRVGWIVKPDDDVARLVTLYIPKRK